MAKKAFVYDGTQWVDIAQSTTDLTNYANMTTTPISGFRNAIINGGFDVWQRGTSFNANGAFTADRWKMVLSGATGTVSRQTFTPGNVIPGYEPQYFLRMQTTVAEDLSRVEQRIEDVRTFAGQEITISFWAKTDSARTITLWLEQNFGTGGSETTIPIVGTISTTNTWQRYSVTTTVASILGKTVGDNSFLALWIGNANFETFNLDIWGVQVERGSVATPFEQRPICTELALCQRYYIRYSNGAALQPLNIASYYTTTGASTHVVFPVEMRVNPVGGKSATSAIIIYSVGAGRASTAITNSQMGTKVAEINITTAAVTAGNAGVAHVTANNWIDFSAEI